MAVGCAPGTCRGGDAPIPRLRSSCRAVRSALTDDGRPPLAAAGLQLHDRLHCHGPEPGAGGKRGLAQGARAPADDPTTWAGRDGVPVARGAGGLWLGPRAAPILHNDTQETGAAVQRRLHGLLGARGNIAKAGPLAPAVEHLLKVSRATGQVYACRSNVPDLPRTNNDLEQFFGAYRSMSGAPPGAKWLRPPWCCAEQSDSSPVRPPAYARSRVKNGT